MSTTTTNYKLIKPALTDAADITAYNKNWDTIDIELKVREKALSDHNKNENPHNITPEKIGAAKTKHTHTLDDVSETDSKKMNHIAVASSTNGINYTATIDGITELYNGLTITVIPNKTSVQRAIKLNLNGLGEKNIRITPTNGSSNAETLATSNNWFSADAPMVLRYHKTTNTWKSDLQMVSVSVENLEGKVPIAKGGTGADTAEKALANLGTIPIKSHYFTGTLSSRNYYVNVDIYPQEVADIDGNTYKRAHWYGYFYIPSALTGTQVGTSGIYKYKLYGAVGGLFLANPNSNIIGSIEGYVYKPIDVSGVCYPVISGDVGWGSVGFIDDTVVGNGSNEVTMYSTASSIPSGSTIAFDVAGTYEEIA